MAVVLGTLVGAAGAANSLETKTLRSSDVPTVYTRATDAACPAACMKRTRGAVPNGYVTGWAATYKRGQIAWIASIVTEFTSAAAAHRFHLATYSTAQHNGADDVSTRVRIGDETNVIHVEKDGLLGYSVMWRRGRFTGVIISVGLVAQVSSVNQAVGLAQKQDRRFLGGGTA